MKNISIHMLNKSYIEKPDKKELAKISKRITEEESQLDIEAFAHAVGECGMPFTPAIFHGSRKKGTFISQTVFALDFDGEMSLDEFYQRSQEYEIIPAFIYETYSCTEKLQRFRAVFINDIVIDNIKAAEMILMMLLKIFPEADPCCKDVSRLFLGGKKLLYLNQDAEINISDLAISVETKIKKDDRHNYTRKIKKLAERMNVAEKNGLLCIHKVKKQCKNEEIREQPSIILESDEDSSFFYIIETPGGHPASRLFTHTYKEISKKDCQDIFNVCPLFRDFYEKDISHEMKFCLATNLIYIKGGKHLFFDGLKDHKDKWEIQWKYIKENSYKPQNCENINCPYLNICKCKNLYEKLSRKIKRIKAEADYITLETAQKMLRFELESAICKKSKGIYLIKAQTALGKTTAYCEIAKQWTGSKPLMIVVPTNKLQKEVFTRLKDNGIIADMTPNLKEVLNLIDDEVRIKVEELYKKGMGFAAKSIIKKYAKENKLYDYQKEVIQDYLYGEKILNGSKLVVTTHAMLLVLKEKILNQYEIIIDEDILMTVFKNTSAISFGDIEVFLSENMVSVQIENRIRRMLSMEDGTVGYTELMDMEESELKELYEKDLPIKDSIPDFLSSDSFYIDVQGEQIHYFKARKLPDVKMIVVSATISKNLYKDYCKGRFIDYKEIPLVKYKGKLKQYTAYSMSRDCIRRLDYPQILRAIRNIMPEKETAIITFKMLNESKNIYFGKTEGFNEYEGKNLLVLGTPHNVPFIYQLIGCSLGYEADEKMTVLEAENNGYLFQIMTYKNQDMRNLQFYFLESELEQAVGRARLLRYPCTVYLFSNFPLMQAEINQGDYMIS